ncbi:MAG: GntG family PLP-dependent aldolase [bacterium]
MKHPVLDMRSDTVTRPSAGMRKAMAEAEVGDDVFGDDPTVNRLQEEVAALLGKEAALYVPSGTMGNQLALKAQTSPGDQIVLEDGAHIYRYEAGGPAALSGLLVTCVKAPGGRLDWPEVAAALNPPDNVHCAPPALVCLENTHNNAGGRVLPQDNVLRIAEGAHARGLRVHLDGARLWHAHVATGLPLAELAAPVDTVSVCFSKGLGAPVGSVVAGDRDAIIKAHRFRKLFGGAMRQAGILAAACLYALEHNLERLAEDHAHAAFIASGLDHPALKVNHPVDTNIVIIDVEGAGADAALLRHLESRGVLGVGFGAGRVRLIPNLDTPADALDRVVGALNSFPGADA